MRRSKLMLQTGPGLYLGHRPGAEEALYAVNDVLL